MGMPYVWGQGQLFAFSALDGESFRGDDFVGILSGDKIGIRFFSKVKRELAVVGLDGSDPVFEVVASDIILIRTNIGEISILYADTHLIIGRTAGMAQPVVMVEGRFTAGRIGDIEIQDTGDGDVTALLRTGDAFFFSYGHSPEEAAGRIQKGVGMSLEAVKQRKLRFFEAHALAQENPYPALYAKCLSVMKTQLYSPEGIFRHIWSTPDRLPHRNLWLWDSVFHAIGCRNLDPQLAESLILAIFDTQADSGFIPHMACVDSVSDVTQPPVIAWGAFLVYERSGNRAFLREVFSRNKKFLLWCDANRREAGEPLYTWRTEDDENCRCGESGMDNSPRFDRNTHLAAIDFSCYMANDTRYMARIAAELGNKGEEKSFREWSGLIKDAINQKLWCGKDGFYYDYDLCRKELHKIRSVASFLPLFAGVCKKSQAEQLVSHLKDPETFHTPLPVPSISRQDPSYGTDMWRGPVWINCNYMLMRGLEDYGCGALARELRSKTLATIDFWYRKKGTVFEFYDPEMRVCPSELNRKGTPFEPYDHSIRVQTIRDFGWSCALTLDMLHSEVKTRIPR